MGIAFAVVVITIIIIVSIMLSTMFFMHWLQKDYFALFKKNDRKSWVEPDLSGYSGAGKWANLHQLGKSVDFHSAKDSETNGNNFEETAKDYFEETAKDSETNFEEIRVVD